MIKVYSKDDCGACGLVKQFLEGNNVEFEYINTDDPGNEKHKEYVFANYMGFPVVEYKDIAFTGFDYNQLNKIVEDVNRE